MAPLHCSSCSQHLHLSCWRRLHLNVELTKLGGMLSWLCPACCTCRDRSRPGRLETRPRGTLTCKGCKRLFNTAVGLHRHLNHLGNISCFLTPPPPPPPGFPGLLESVERHAAAVRSKVLKIVLSKMIVKSFSLGNIVFKAAWRQTQRYKHHKEGKISKYLAPRSGSHLPI